MSGKLQIVVGGQFGSEGKGALAAWLARREWRPLLAVRVAGPNAGHTAYDDTGREFKLQQIPVAAVVKQHTPGQIALAIAAGSEIEMSILEAEKTALDQAGHRVSERLFVDGQATLISRDDVVRERGGVAVGTGTPGAGTVAVLPLEHGTGGLTKRIGSTGKGVGAARAARIMREAQRYGMAGEGLYEGISVARMIRSELSRDHTVMIEGTQGYGLGLHAGFYPYCTSSDCRAIDFLSMAGVSPWAAYVNLVEVWVALRTNPIRVAGDSGPLFGETTWEDVGQPPEYTTVTKKIRRVGQFDAHLARRAIEENGGTGRVKVALMFGDYVDPTVKGKDLVLRRKHAFIEAYERLIEHKISVVGTGPQTIAVVED